MDNNIEGSSNLSSSSSDDDNYAESFSARQQLIAQVISTNNQIVLNYLNEGSNKSRHRGSIHGHKMINCNREAADRNLFNDYFTENALYNDAMFRRRFRMGRNLFMRICDAVTNHDNYFIQRRDGLGRLGLPSLQKITAAFRILAYGVPADATDEYIKIGESTAIESVKRFCRAIVEVFGEQYLRSPNAHDVVRLLHIGELRGFPAACITILAHYVIQGKEYNMSYYLADGIYPKWSTLVQTIHAPQGRKNKLFAMKQEACRKDVERAFGVLQSRFAIVAGPSRFWQKNILHDILTSCIIMNNMIIEDERDLNAPIVEHFEVSTPDVELAVDDVTRFEEFLARYRHIKDKEAQIALRNAFIEHLWEQYSNYES
ncbi:uncharacterized protein LOC121989924 [Zingiber officinale]|uniref:uncharacterized protein LOC121989924 n=1 Tax=Zingiber officinale TaxID=94328 RepID=UPI001C4DC062|nr:uncharacterized protein LOC121989924 [Zingiber officinale]